MAEIIIKITRTGTPREPNRSPTIERSVQFDKSISTRVSSPGAKMIFPVHAVLEDSGRCSGNVGVILTALRHSPAPKGVPPEIEVIGTESRTLSLDGPNPLDVGNAFCQRQGFFRRVEATFDLAVTMPGVLNAVALVAAVVLVGSESVPGSIPSICNKSDPLNPISPLCPLKVIYPSPECKPGFEQQCMLVGVHPTGILIPDVLPITIVYEPPGNCSWAFIKQNKTAGVQMEIAETNEENRDILVDRKAGGGLLINDQSRTVQNTINSQSRISRF